MATRYIVYSILDSSGTNIASPLFKSEKQAKKYITRNYKTSYPVKCLVEYFRGIPMTYELYTEDIGFFFIGCMVTKGMDLGYQFPSFNPMTKESQGMAFWKSMMERSKVIKEAFTKELSTQS